jgi:hypothetical protein
MTARAPDARPAPVAAPTARQLGVAPELAVLAVLEAAIHSAIPALCAAQPELCAAAPDAGGSSRSACAAERAILLALELREALHGYRLALEEEPRRDDPLPF